MCCGRVARQWTPEHGVYDTGKVFLMRSAHTEYMHTHTEPNKPTRMCPCGVWRSAQVHIQTPVQREYKGACTSRSRNAEDKRRVLKGKASPRLIAPINLEG